MNGQRPPAEPAGQQQQLAAAVLGVPPGRQDSERTQELAREPTPETAKPGDRAGADAEAAAAPAGRDGGRPVAVPAAAVPPVPAGPGDGAGSAPVRGDRAGWRARRHRRLSRLRIGRHAATADGLDRIQLTAGSFGLPLGRSQESGPVVLPMFRPRPTTVAVLGEPATARMIVFRALRFGARAVVRTDRPDYWKDIGPAATGRRDRVSIVPPEEWFSRHGTPVAPVLWVHDAAVVPRTVTVAGAESAKPAPSGWQTDLLVLRDGTPQRLELLRTADVALVRRLPPGEASAAAAALGLPVDDAYLLRVLHEDMLAMVAAGIARYVWTDPDGGSGQGDRGGAQGGSQARVRGPGER
ncbi:hypothetical protein [Qaidamihabitans albus]|uniref:hypothetical protein n=1 Tax=Qaidamihabitans albus TaxID=2795733 RepID=UPI0018F24212|nr:hypothetical protein [Qaidamihabitans albus]